MSKANTRMLLGQLLKAQNKKRKTRSPGEVLTLNSRPKAFISSDDVLKANKEREEAFAKKY